MGIKPRLRHRSMLPFVLLIGGALLFGACSKNAEEASSGSVRASSEDTSTAAPDKSQQASTTTTQTKKTSAPKVTGPRPTLLSLDKKLKERYEWEEDEDDIYAESILLVKATTVLVGLSEEDAAKYPALAKTLSRAAEEKEKDFEKRFEEYVAETRSGYTDKYYHFVDTQVRRADSVAVSLIEKHFYYAEMSYSRYSTITYDTQTGEECKLTDIVRDTAKLPAIIMQGMSASMQKVDDISESSIQSYFDRRGFTWTLDYDGITFYFNEHTLSDVWHPTVTAKVLFAGNEDVFYEKYILAPESYMVGLNGTYLCDLDEDGELDGFTYYEIGAEDFNQWVYGMQDGFSLVPDSADWSWKLSEECLGREYSPYYVKMADGTSLLYLICDSYIGGEDPGRPLLLAYELTPKSCNFVGELQRGLTQTKQWPGGDRSYAIATDPENLRLRDWDSSAFAYRNAVYRIGSDYLPVKK